MIDIFQSVFWPVLRLKISSATVLRFDISLLFSISEICFSISLIFALIFDALSFIFLSSSSSFFVSSSVFSSGFSSYPCDLLSVSNPELHNFTLTFQSSEIFGHHSVFVSKWYHDQSLFSLAIYSSHGLNRSFSIFQASTTSRFQFLFFLNFTSFSQCLTVIISPSCKLFSCLRFHFIVHTSFQLCVSLRFCHSTHDLIPSTSCGLFNFFQSLSFLYSYLF